jgi:hypothetical protein
MTRETLVKNAASLLRPIATAIAVGGAVFLVVGSGCHDEGVGDPCTPAAEYDTSFLGFDKKEVQTESKSYQCRTRLCLINHFQGRVSCPYGQDSDGGAPDGAAPCTVPGSETPIDGRDPDSGTLLDPIKGAQVDSQCLDRSADKAVYCSCRCADSQGQRPSDQNFCDCPDGFQCQPLVPSTGTGNEGLTGSYCIKQNTVYNSSTACSQGNCDPSIKSKACN